MLDPDVLAWRLEAEPGDDFYMTVFETRRLIEPAVAALAAKRATEAEIAELEAAFARMEESVGHDMATYIEADIRFHEVILVGCHNELLTNLGSICAGSSRDLHPDTGRRRADAIPPCGRAGGNPGRRWGSSGERDAEPDRDDGRLSRRPLRVSLSA